MGTNENDKIEHGTISDFLDEMDIEFISKKIEGFDQYKNLPIKEEPVND